MVEKIIFLLIFMSLPMTTVHLLLNRQALLIQSVPSISIAPILSHQSYLSSHRRVSHLRSSNPLLPSTTMECESLESESLSYDDKNVHLELGKRKWNETTTPTSPSKHKSPMELEQASQHQYCQHSIPPLPPLPLPYLLDPLRFGGKPPIYSPSISTITITAITTCWWRFLSALT